MPGGGNINIRIRRVGESLSISVIDTGRGIREEDRRFIFDPFFTSKMEGAGLGLTMALKIFQAHGGNISIRSDPGKGTEVIILCPVAVGQSSP